VRILFVQPAPFEPGPLGLENACWLSELVQLAKKQWESTRSQRRLGA
jgi:hypothetical protein